MSDEFDGFAESGVNVYLEECHSCGRKFNFDALERHHKICSNLKQRKPFDIKKQRLKGLGVEKVPKQPEPKKVLKKADWRRKHEEFISTIRSARGVTAAIKSGGPLPPPPPATINPDYVQCPHCGRNFSEHAAERHMPFCKEQKARQVHSNHRPSAARDKQNKRIQYRPPLPGRRNTDGDDAISPARAKPLAATEAHHRLLNNDTTPPNRAAIKTTSAPAKSSAARAALAGGKGGRSPHTDVATTTAAVDRSKQRASSGSSTSDSEYSARKTPKKEPQWYEDMIKSKNRPPPQQQQQQQYAMDVRKNAENEIIETDIGYSSDRPVHSGRRRGEHGGANENSGDSRQSAAVGVVRPSSRHSPSSPVYANNADGIKSGRGKPARFCHECGTKYPVESAKYCCECGMRRVHIDR